MSKSFPFIIDPFMEEVYHLVKQNPNPKYMDRSSIAYSVYQDQAASLTLFGKFNSTYPSQTVLKNWWPNCKKQCDLGLCCLLQKALLFTVYLCEYMNTV